MSWRNGGKDGKKETRGFDGKEKKHVLYNPACAKIKIEMAFELAYVITIN